MKEENKDKVEKCKEKPGEGDGRIMLGQKDLELIAEVIRRELRPFRSEMTTEMSSFKGEITEEMKSFKGEMAEEMSSFKGEITGEMKSFKSEISDDMESFKHEVYDMIEPLRRDVKEVQLTLENETNKNICIIAEGHLDLNRKLDEALKIREESELLHIRVTNLEGEVRRMKDRIEVMA